MSRILHLGVNIDHVATIRNARGGRHPDPVRAARLAAAAGADGITVHLREDRRHISDDDLSRLIEALEAPINLEMAATTDMLAIALRHRPHAVCVVPEKRREVTTEGGLDAVAGEAELAPIVAQLADAGCRVALFIDPEVAQLEAARRIGAPVVELHTGAYCGAERDARDAELERLSVAAAHAEQTGLECHAGHGITFETVGAVAALPPIVELNIGHFLIGEAIFSGLESSIKRMRALMDQARANATSERSA
jgi:pyridoxine 5-phosphate synthase